MELGYGQAQEGLALLEESGYLTEVRTVRDLEGRERVVLGEKK